MKDLPIVNLPLWQLPLSESRLIDKITHKISRCFHIFYLKQPNLYRIGWVMWVILEWDFQNKNNIKIFYRKSDTVRLDKLKKTSFLREILSKMRMWLTLLMVLQLNLQLLREKEMILKNFLAVLGVSQDSLLISILLDLQQMVNLILLKINFL